MLLKQLPNASNHGATIHLAHKAISFEMGRTRIVKLRHPGVYIQIWAKFRQAKVTPHYSAQGIPHVHDRKR